MSKSQKVNDIMADLQNVDTNDQDAMIAQLNEIALRVAEAQGKKVSTSSNNVNVAADPMDALGCEGCQ